MSGLGIMGCTVYYKLRDATTTLDQLKVMFLQVIFHLFLCTTIIYFIHLCIKVFCK